ncbi:MAG: hypothetical protein Q4A72_03775 [Bacillota bacterium]|nr:hypothetical protein [Bacillota bacterium]
MDNYTFRQVISELLKQDMVVVDGKGRATNYRLKRTSSEMSFGLKKLLRLLEDKIRSRE